MAEVDVPVGVRRPVVEHEFRRAAALLANPTVEVHRLPARNGLRLRALQIGLHRKTCARQVHRVFPLGHVIKLYPDAETYNASVSARSDGSDSAVPMMQPAEQTLGHVHEELHDNGLRVPVQEVRTAPPASAWCRYRVGSKNEGPGRTGVSHWVEHMNFKGTTNIPRDKVKGIIEQFGGYWNGYTWIDETTYTETATRDAPDTLLDQELTAAAFKAHPYRHPTIGWLSDLETMTRDDLYGYYRRHYVPNNATLVVVGDVDADDALRRIESHFGAIPSGPEPSRLRTVEPEQIGERRLQIRKEGNTTYV